MKTSEWNPDARALWDRLTNFTFGVDEAIVDFSSRLASENGWERGYALRVIEEYRRFLFLAVQAGHPVTPSEAVDQAWHLHLVFTRSYWSALCAKTLGRPLHHEPTTGGAAEKAKFSDQYLRTRESYRTFFGEEPPAEIWPVGAGHAAKHRWVDISSHWLLPKPRWISRFRPGILKTAGVATLAVIFLAGFTSSANVLDWSGSEFLRFYRWGALWAFALSFGLVAAVRWSGERRRPVDPLLDPYEIAFLGGGGGRLIEAALATLFSRGMISAKKNKNNKAEFVLVPQDDTSGLHPMEKKLLLSFPRLKPARLSEIRSGFAPLTEVVREELIHEGWIFSKTKMLSLRLLAAAPVVLLMMIGIGKVMVGLDRHRPVSYLVISLVITSILLVLRLIYMNRRTPTGEALWKRIKLESRIAEKAKDEAAGSSLAPASVAMLVALGGVGALEQLPGFYSFYDSMRRYQQSSGSGCGTSCSSDGGGGGGGGSSCGGGGGCGGCGGGGGD